MTHSVGITELTDYELDAVAAGAKGLVAIDISNVDILNNSNVLTNFLNSNSILNGSLNNNTVQVPIGVAVAVLGRAEAFALSRA